MKTFGEYVTTGLRRRQRASASSSSRGAASSSATVVVTSASIRRDSNAAFVYRETKGDAMRFMFLVHGDSEAEAALTPDERRTIVGEHIAYADMLRDRDAYVLGEALTGEAVTVRPSEKPLVTDGPFAETKEAVGGFYVV